MGFRPLVFVAMPFGRKQSPDRTIEIDFDNIYERAIVPAIHEADMDVIRADEERLGGFIHLPMYERLLLAEIAIVDLTFANPNVFYELGIRHAARPRTTIMIYSHRSTLPFDVGPLRAIPYCLDEDGQLDNDAAGRLTTTLAAKLREALQNDTTDSPLFQLIPSLPGISLPHEATESFRDRARRINDTRTRVEQACYHCNREEALRQLACIQEELVPFASAPPELLVDLLLAYRDLKDVDSMIELVGKLPDELKRHRTTQEQLAFALNRRNVDGDRQRAIRVLENVIRNCGMNPETCGIMGRIYKDMHLEAMTRDTAELAQGYLEEAIRWYRQGFESDIRDYYPGVNAVMLLVEKGDEEAIEEAKQLLPVVEFAVARRGGVSSNNYWDVATVLHLATLQEDWKLAQRAAIRFGVLVTHAWVVETTLRDMKMVEKAMSRSGHNTDQLQQLIEQLEKSWERLT